MMAATQPFISGAISKTVNLPQTATVEDIADAYTRGWKGGLKALAIYRDGSKTAQALRTDAQEDAEERTADLPRRSASGCRSERESITHKFSIAGHEGYITAGKYEDGSVGEIFLTDIGKEGSTMRGLLNAFATAISLGLQYGVPLEDFVRKFSYMRFEPEGMTTNPEIPFAKSMPDYIMRWLASRFVEDPETLEELGIMTSEVRAKQEAETAQLALGADAGGSAGPANGGNGGNRGPEAGRRGRCADRNPPGPSGEDGRRRPRPRLRAVRRHDAAHGRPVTHAPAAATTPAAAESVPRRLLQAEGVAVFAAALALYIDADFSISLWHCASWRPPRLPRLPDRPEGGRNRL